MSAITPVDRLQRDINLLHRLADSTTNVQQLSSILKHAEQIQINLAALLQQNSTPAPTRGILSKLYSSPTAPAAMPDEEARRIRDAVDAQIATIKAKFEQIMQSLSGSTASALGYPPLVTGLPSSASSSAISAVGFKRENNNCAFNSLLQLVVHIPSLRTAFEIVGRHYENDRSNALNAYHGAAMMRALRDYDAALLSGTHLPTTVSQSIRLAMHHFFPIISASSFQTEDAYELMQLLMGKYQDVALEQGLALVPSLYTPIETKRVYKPEGQPRPADPNKLQQTKRAPDHHDSYSILSPDNSSSVHNPDYQIFLDLQNHGHLCFNELIKNYFRSENRGGDQGTYLRPDDQLQDFTLKSENRQFQANPQELILSVKRFGFNLEKMTGFKITAPLAIPRSFSLPQEATVNGDKPTYDLDAFIVHNGGYGGGHYTAFRKIQDTWFEFNDSAVRRLSDQDIDRILGNATGSSNTSYIHHYRLRTQPQQSSSLPAQSEIGSSMPILSPSIESLLQVSQAQAQICDKNIQNLNQLYQLINEPSTPKEAIDRCIQTLPKHIVDTFDYLIWINEKMPDAPNFGTIIRTTNPRHLAEIRNPWLSCTGNNLIEQIIALEAAKKQKAQKQENIYQLEKLLQQLKSPAVSEFQLKQTFENLPKEIQQHIEYLIYLSHKIKYGEAVVHDPKYNHNYGHNILFEKGIRNVLLNANEAVLNAHGKNIIEQLKSSKEMEIAQDKHTSDSQALQAYLALLRRNESEISTKQLNAIFQSISPDLKEKFYMLIYIANAMPPIDNYGKLEFQKNPRLLLTTTEPLLIGPPQAPTGASLIEQMITLLS